MDLLVIQSGLTLVLVSIWAPRSSSSRTMMMLPRREAMCRGVIPFWQEEQHLLEAATPSLSPVELQGGMGQTKHGGHKRPKPLLRGMGERVGTWAPAVAHC